MSSTLDPFVRGISVGAFLLISLAAWNSNVSRQARIATIMVMLGFAAWVTCGSPTLFAALGQPFPVLLLSLPVAGLLWLFVKAVFEDRSMTWTSLSPVAILLVAGLIFKATRGALQLEVWTAHVVFSGLLIAHAGAIVIHGWRGDLVESRRRLRGLAFTFAVLYGVVQVAAMLFVQFVFKRYPGVPGFAGACGLAVTALAWGGLMLNGRASLFGPARRPEARLDHQGEAADGALLAKLQAFMADGGWRAEGLTIGAVANAIGAPEHRLRRLIKQKLGHRNFPDYINSYRIEAAKRQLADPDAARTTVAAIAFDLGYGSLGPFNRAFRAATGATPTEWRRQALTDASPLLKEAG